jgi:hypothetical protein
MSWHRKVVGAQFLSGDLRGGRAGFAMAAPMSVVASPARLNRQVFATSGLLGFCSQKELPRNLEKQVPNYLAKYREVRCAMAVRHIAGVAR